MRSSIRFAKTRLFLALILLLASAGQASACMCRKDSVEEGLANSDLVFMAEVRGAWRFGLPDRILTKVDIELIHVKKGDRSAVPKQLITSNWDGHCGMEILVPARYWFFTDKDGRFNRCTATDLISDERFTSLRKETRLGLIAWFRSQAAQSRAKDERKMQQP